MGRLMVERAQVRCQVCRIAVPVPVLWSGGEGLSAVLTVTARSSPTPDAQWPLGQGDHVGSDARHVAAAARSLHWADRAAAREDYAVALGRLQTVEATGDQLSEAYETSRRMWQLALDADRPAG
jgi:hypothetical protein